MTAAKESNRGASMLAMSLVGSRIQMKGDYPYVITPLCDGIPFINAYLLREVVAEMKERIKPALAEADVIVTIEAMGIPLATALSLETNIPFNVVRKRSYGLPGEREVEQETGYSHGSLFVNDLRPGDRVVIVDDVLSTGGTLRALVKTLEDMGVVVLDIIVAVNKSTKRSHPLGTKTLVKSLVRLKVEGEHIRVYRTKEGDCVEV